MKKYILISLCLLTAAGSFAQNKDFKFKFYGQIRTDFYYNSRANEETVDGLFYMYPKDKVRDEDGNDLNSTPNSNFYTLYSRLGVDVAGPKLGTAKTSAKVEIDFRGTGTSYSVIRLRHAYLNLDWGKSALLLGQTWHPLFGNPPPPCLFESGLGQVRFIAGTDMASAVRKCLPSDSEPFRGSAFPTVQPCAANPLSLH